MIYQEEAQNLINKFIDLRKKAEESNSPQDLKLLQQHEKLCIDKFTYIVTMKAAKYKQFDNYEDLVQDGLEALVKAMKTYNPKFSNFFWWAHKYIDTKISRSANLHSTIRFPLKFAKKHAPFKELELPLMIDEKLNPEQELALFEAAFLIDGAVKNLSDENKEMIDLLFGLEDDQPISINKICKKLKITRTVCLHRINDVLDLIKNNIKI
jgi:RNA polymerase sigma factor (sigma-70 family)